jgi:drug/metabolite transporter (DMT)-like permease
LNKRTTGHLALLFTNLFFAINLSAVKHLTHLQLAKPFGINVVRVGVSIILFWLLFLLKPVNIKIARQDIGRFVLCAITGVVINQLLFLKGLSLTYSIHASLLMLTTPILIVFIAAWILKERISFTKITGLVLGVTGALLLVLHKENSGEGNNIVLGDLLIIINAVSYTFYFVLVKPLMLKYEPIMIIRWIFSIGFVLILPFGLTEFKEIRWTQFTPIDYTCMGLIVLAGTFLAYLFNIFGIKILGAAVAGFYIYTQPVFAAIIAMIFLKEGLSLYKIAAAVLIFTGVYLANKPTTNGAIYNRRVSG